ncbi:MAG: acyl-CoA dehydrogenase family protein [Acetobacteraceae bacterium]
MRGTGVLMDFDFAEEDLALQSEMRRFAEHELRPAARDLDETASFPSGQIAKLAELGVMGLNVPESYGGSGASALALVLAMEEMSAACAATASVVGAHFLATDSLLIGGSETLKQRFLVPAAKGEVLGAYALTEPMAGSDVASMRTRAVREGERYHIQGVKHFISNGGEADFVVVYARTDPDAGHRGISAFVVERSTPGFSVGHSEDLMGIRGGRVYELTFDCHVPLDHLVGTPGGGFKIAMAVLDRGRIEVAAMSLGIARAAFDDATAWSRQRVSFGHPIASYQGIQWMLADMETALEAARLLTYRAAWLRGRATGRFTREAAMAKLFASEAVGRITDLALQIHGGYGYTRSLPLERYLRDARILRIYEGTSEMQRNIIARHRLG